MVFNFKNALENLEYYGIMEHQRNVEEETERVLKSIIDIFYNRNIINIAKIVFSIERLSDSKDILKVDYYKFKSDSSGDILFSTEPQDIGFNKDLLKSIGEELKSEGFKFDERYTYESYKNNNQINQIVILI